MVTSVAVVDDAAGVFSAANLSSIVPAGGSVPVAVRFSPNATGAFNATLKSEDSIVRTRP